MFSYIKEKQKAQVVSYFIEVVRMGRPFSQEIKAIDDTYAFSVNIDSTKLEKYILENITAPFLVVGSGGSFAVALTCALLIDSFGGFAKATTPYELMNSLKSLCNCNVMFFSASGNNADIINAYNFCKKNGAKSTFILCIRESSKLVMEAINKYHDTYFLETTLPVGNDGFLAVNSSLCALAILESVYQRVNKITSFTRAHIAKSLSADVLKCLDAHSIIALGGRWTTPVVFDFESKCTEAGLINVMPADLRNFAHGRHHWVAKNPDTSVICFVTENERVLAEKTLKLLPPFVNKSIIVSSCNGVSATIELLTQLFLVIQKLGESKGIDPGKPGVPEYGSKLYHLSYNPLSEIKATQRNSDDLLDRMTIRKVKSIGLSEEKCVDVKVFAQQFLKKLSSASFRGLVLDYDNTIISHNDVTDSTYLLCLDCLKNFAENGVYICFATGRGKSIRDQLKCLFPSHLQEKIYICYYNGASILPLATEPESATNQIDPNLQKLIVLLAKEAAFSDIKQSLRNTNLSIEGPVETLNSVYSFLTRKILEGEIKGLKLARSDHSIDVMLSSISKESAVLFTKEKCLGEVLCIGDSGDETGNDYCLLSNEYALSVGSVSTSMENCWNISSFGLNGPSATLEYLSKLQMTKKGLRFCKSYLKI